MPTFRLLGVGLVWSGGASVETEGRQDVVTSFNHLFIRH